MSTEVNTGGPTIALQIVDPKTLRKLLAKIEQIPKLNALIEEIVNQPFVVTTETQNKLLQRLEGALGIRNLEEFDILTVKKVKENAHMTAFLREVKVYLETGNFTAARKAIVRLVDSKNTPTLPQPTGVKQ